MWLTVGAGRVAEAGAIGLIVVNNEDTLVSPGDSAREGTEIEFPVVGVRLSDADRYVSPFLSPSLSCCNGSVIEFSLISRFRLSDITLH